MVRHFKSELSVNGGKASAQFIVVKQGRCLLGYSTVVELGVLLVSAVPTPVAENCNTVGMLLQKIPRQDFQACSMELAN